MYIATANGAGRLTSGVERRNHATRARGRPDMRMTAYEGLLQLTRFWVGAGSQPQNVQLNALDANTIFEALEQGQVCLYGDWTLRGIPTRKGSVHYEMDLGWETSLSVASVHGFRTFGGMDLPSIQEACGYITRRDLEIRKQKYVQNHFSGPDSLI